MGAKKKSGIEMDLFEGRYHVKDGGARIGAVKKIGNNRWVATSLPVKTRNEAVHILLRAAKAKK